jgi:hypothetical protein
LIIAIKGFCCTAIGKNLTGLTLARAYYKDATATTPGDDNIRQ